MGLALSGSTQPSTTATRPQLPMPPHASSTSMPATILIRHDPGYYRHVALRTADPTLLIVALLHAAEDLDRARLQSDNLHQPRHLRT